MYIDIDNYVPVIADHGSLDGLCGIDFIREDCRSLALCNEFAINAIENRINYVIGQGHRYHVVPKQPCNAPLAEEVHEILNEFLEENDWTRRQQEIMRRRDRDGEVFLRLFPARQGTMKIRFVEPEQIYTPTEYFNNPSH